MAQRGRRLSTTGAAAPSLSRTQLEEGEGTLRRRTHDRSTHHCRERMTPQRGGPGEIGVAETTGDDDPSSADIFFQVAQSMVQS